MLLEQMVDFGSQWHACERRPARVHAIVLPILGPFLRGLNELPSEVPAFRKPLFNLQAACQANIDIRLHDGKLGRRQALLALALLEIVDVDPNFVCGLVAATEDLNGVGDVRRRNNLVRADWWLPTPLCSPRTRLRLWSSLCPGWLQ